MSIVDIHSHVLTGIDDGSRNMETSVAMLQESFRQGVELQVATPHFYAHKNRILPFLETRRESYTALQKQMNSETPKLLLGAEVAYFDKISRAEDIERLCIGKTDLLLLELPFCPWTEIVMEDVDTLQRKRGLRVVLAHLERFLSYRPNRKYITELLASDCLVQINCESLLTLKERIQIRKWLKKGQVDFLGTDAHGMHHRPPNMAAGRSILQEKYPKALAHIDKQASLLE